MTYIAATLGVSAALLFFKATRTLGVIGFLLVSYIHPTIDLVLAGVLLAGMVLNVC
jgi:hypothetical protein